MRKMYPPISIFIDSDKNQQKEIQQKNIQNILNENGFCNISHEKVALSKLNKFTKGLHMGR